MKKLILILGILLLAGLTLLGATDKSYAIQLKADTDETVITAMEAELLKQEMPAYIVKAKVKGKLYHRLRLGPFAERSDAELFAEYHEFKDYWITVERKSGRRVVEVVQKKVSEIHSGALGIYFGEKRPFLLLYKYNIGIAGTIVPSDGYLFRMDGKTRHFADITGFEETKEGIDFGKSFLVFIDYDETEVKNFEQFAGEIKAFASKKKITEKMIKDNILYFNELHDARVTLLMSYNFTDDKELFYPDPGFDYLNKEGKRESFYGNIEKYKKGRERRKYIPGNYRAQFFNLMRVKKINSLKSENITIFTKEINSVNYDFMVLFFK